MIVKVYGREYLITQTYDKIRINNSSNNIAREDVAIKIESASEKEQKELFVIKDEIIKALDLDILSEYEKIGKIVSIFLNNNTIEAFNAFSHNLPFDRRFDFLIRATNGKELECDVKIDRNNYLKFAFFGVWKEIVGKYEKDCIKFMEENNDKKIYCLVNNFSIKSIDEIEQYPTSLNAYQVAPLGSIFTLYPFFSDLEDEKERKVVYICDGFTNKCQLFENRLKIEQETANLEIVEVKESKIMETVYILKITCNDCIFILMDMTSSMLEKINNIIEQHNQSIETSKRLLKMVEKNIMELW